MNEKLTAYALHELPEDERAALEAQMKNDPALRAEAEQMKTFCEMLTKEMHASTEEEALKPEQRTKLVQTFHTAERKVVRPFWRRGNVLSGLGLAAAACLAFMLTVHQWRVEKETASADSGMVTIRPEAPASPPVVAQNPPLDDEASPAPSRPRLKRKIGALPASKGLSVPDASSAATPSLAKDHSAFSTSPQNPTVTEALRGANGLKGKEGIAKQSESRRGFQAPAEGKPHQPQGSLSPIQEEAGSASFAGTVIKSGSGTLVLNNGSTYTGGVSVNAGTLNGTLSAGAPPPAASSAVGTGGLIAATGAPTSNLTIASSNASDPVPALENPAPAPAPSPTLAANKPVPAADGLHFQYMDGSKAKEANASAATSGNATHEFIAQGATSPATIGGMGGFAAAAPRGAPPASRVPAVALKDTADLELEQLNRPVAPSSSEAQFAHHKELSEKMDALKKEAAALPEGSAERVVKEKELKGKYGEMREDEDRINALRLRDEETRIRLLIVEREEAERRLREQNNTATYRHVVENPFTLVTKQPLSTFSLDVDTASYANVRRFLNANMRPPADAVRLEEMVNYFPYDSYPAPKDDKPVAVKVDMAQAPWQPLHRLARIAVKARDIQADQRPAANFTFLLDVSGSMSPPERLPLVKQALRLLVEQLREDDRVSIVTYAGNSGLALPSTAGDQKETILEAVNHLHAGGSTNGAGGIRLAYEQAVQHFKKGGINRVILCTDGDFNVGMSSVHELEGLIAEKAKSGVFLSVLGVGTDNLHDHTMQALADRGNGNYHYLDSMSEARKVLVDQMTGTLVTVAKDVKIQIEFNPTQVAAYRLIGYEKRLLAKEDFNNDKKDAGDLGAGHTITALYEIVPASLKYPNGEPVVDSLKYAPSPAAAPAAPAEAAAPDATAKDRAAGAAASKETMTVKLRYKEPTEDTSQLMEIPVTDSEKTLEQNDKDFQFAVAVAEFGMLLRDSPYGAELTWDSVRALALAGKGKDLQGWRGEFVQLIEKARGIYGVGR